MQEHHISYNPEIKIQMCEDHHNLHHKHGVGKGEGYRIHRKKVKKLIDSKLPFIQITGGSQGHYHFPKSFTTDIGIHCYGFSMGFAFALWNQDTPLDIVAESLDLISADLRLIGR